MLSNGERDEWDDLLNDLIKDDRIREELIQVDQMRDMRDIQHSTIRICRPQPQMPRPPVDQLREMLREMAKDYVIAAVRNTQQYYLSETIREIIRKNMIAAVRSTQRDELRKIVRETQLAELRKMVRETIQGCLKEIKVVGELRKMVREAIQGYLKEREVVGELRIRERKQENKRRLVKPERRKS